MRSPFIIYGNNLTTIPTIGREFSSDCKKLTVMRKFELPTVGLYEEIIRSGARTEEG